MRGVWFDQMYTVLSISYHNSMVSIAWRNIPSQIHVNDLSHPEQSTSSHHLSFDIEFRSGMLVHLKVVKLSSEVILPDDAPGHRKRRVKVMGTECMILQYIFTIVYYASFTSRSYF